jgi:arylsulfatase A-like enzyme
MNLILIIIDTLRYDYVGANGNTWIKTPNLDRLASRSWVFDYSFTNAYPTIPHRNDVATGRFGRPFHKWGPLPFDVLTLPRVLSSAGYATQLIHDTPHMANGATHFDAPFHGWSFIRGAEVDRPWIDARSDWSTNWKRDPAFDFVSDRELMDNHVIPTYARANRKRKAYEDWNAAQVFLTAAEFLRDNATRENFFLWIDCFDPHEPWDTPPDFARMYDERQDYDGLLDPRSFVGRNAPDLGRIEKQHIAAQYAAKVSWVDHWFGKFLDALEATGLDKNTAVLLTADHGTNVGERGQFGKGYPVREQEAHTPFMVCAPGAGTGRSDMLVQPQDVLPTLLGIAGVPVPEAIPAGTFDVLSLAQKGRRTPRQLVVASRSAQQWGASQSKIVFTAFDRDWYLEFALKPEDSLLTRMGHLENVQAQYPEVVAAMRAEALDEMTRRGTDPKLMAWLRGQGEVPFPADARPSDFEPEPEGWGYVANLYRGNE